MNHKLFGIILLLVVTRHAKLMVVLFSHYHNIGGNIAVSTQLSAPYYGNSKDFFYIVIRINNSENLQKTLNV